VGENGRQEGIGVSSPKTAESFIRRYILVVPASRDVRRLYGFTADIHR